MNVIFLGTPEFAVESLRAILGSRHRVLAVVSQPDRETDQKGNTKPTPVKAFALSQGLTVFQYDKVCVQGLEEIRALKPDVMVTAAFGQILTDDFLNIAPVYNIHASCLPLYRGSAPIQAAILNGDSETGVTIMKTVRAMDAGDILLQEKTAIGTDEPFYSLHDRLSIIGAKLIVDALDKTQSGKLKAVPQNHDHATFTKKIKKADGLIDWWESAETIARKVRAFNPWPSAYTYYYGDNIKIYSAICIKTESMRDIARSNVKKAGQILLSDVKKGLMVWCGSDSLKILSLQAPGKRVLSTEEFLRGYALAAGAQFSAEGKQ